MLVIDALKRNNNNLDLIRIICAISVIFSHSLVLAKNVGHSDPLNSIVGFAYIGPTAVKIFFFISGILVTNSLITTKNATHFVVSRFFRVYPAYVFLIIISTFIIGPILTSLSYNDYMQSPVTLMYAWENIFLNTHYFLPGVFDNNIYQGSVNGSLWTIPYEVAAYAILLGIYFIFGSRNRLLLSAICIVVILSPAFGLNKILFINSTTPEVYMLAPCFALGALFAINRDFIKVSLSIPIGFFILFYFVSDAFLSQMFFYFMMCTLALYVSTVNIVKYIKPRHDISYGIYLWGFLVQQIIYNYIPSLSLHLNQIICIAVTIVFSYISFFVVEQPSMKIGKTMSLALQQIPKQGLT
jgi:peptidoglycan/LPS O-acetylase OafA/YrhL